MGAQALLEAQALAVLERVNDAIEWSRNHVTGGVVSDGGTTQATGANGALNFDADVAQLEGMCGGVPFLKAAATDIDSDSGDDVVWGATSGKDVSFSVVVHTGSTGSDAAAYVALHGDVADTGESDVPTKDEIDTALGHENWNLVADVVISRTGDTAVTFGSPSYARRSALGSKVNTGATRYTDPLYTDELTWRTGS